MRVSLATSPTHDLPTATGEVSSPQSAGAFTAGPGVVLVLIVIAVLLAAALGRALAVFWAVVRSMLGLIGSLALALAGVVVVAGLMLSSTPGPARPQPSPRPSPPASRPTPTPVPSGSIGAHRLSVH